MTSSEVCLAAGVSLGPAAFPKTNTVKVSQHDSIFSTEFFGGMARSALLWLCTSAAALLLVAANQLRPVAFGTRLKNNEIVSRPRRQAMPRDSPPLPAPSQPPPPSPPTIDLVIAADAPLWAGVAGVIRSARLASTTPDVLRFHLITLPSQVIAAHRSMQCFGVARRLSVVALPDELLLASRVRVTADPKVTGHLASPLNFARFYLPRLLPPSLKRVLYLDADVIVQADVRPLFATALPPRVAVAAVPRADAHFRYARYVKKCDAIYAARHNGEHLNASAATFNAGVALVDLVVWARLNLTAEAEWWMGQHAAAPAGLWALGSQPIMHLAVHGRWAALPEMWNVDGLGRVANLRPATLKSARVLHWTGRRKPWAVDGLYTAAFARHVAMEEVRRCATSDEEVTRHRHRTHTADTDTHT